MSVFVTYPRAGDGNLANDQGSGAMPAGVASAEAGGTGSDRGKYGAVVGTSGGDDSSSKDDASKGGGAVVEPRSKIPQQPGSQACREIWASRDSWGSRAKRHAAPARPGGRKESAPAGPGGRKESAPAAKKTHWPKNENTLRKSPMSKLTNQAAWFSDNEKNWDDRANLHMAGDYCGLSRLLADPDAISEELALDIGRFGDLAGKQVMHLQCHVGTDTIGFARRGAARVVGLDLSETSLAHARAIADKAGVDVEYVHANVYDARQAVSGDFDLVYTSIGVLCWLPDVVQWARVIASLLKPGGTFFIRDDHPMFMAIGEDVSDGLKIEQPYFQLDTPMTWDDDSSYVDTPGAPRIAHTTNHQWNHSLGQIITALIDAGLVVDGVEEFTYSAWCPWPGLMEQHADGMWRLREQPERLPLQFAISAHKA